MFSLSAPILGLISGAFGYFAADKKAGRDHQLALIEAVSNKRRKEVATDRRSHDAADKRDAKGRWVRRVIALMVIGVMCLGPYLLGFAGIKAYMRDEYQTPEWLLGLIPSMTKIVYTELDGVVVNIMAVVDLAYMVGGFYFGASAGRGK